jgi:hypothetical protein
MTRTHRDIIPLWQKFTPEEQIKVKNAVDLYIGELIKDESERNFDIVEEQGNILDNSGNPQLIIDYLQIVERSDPRDAVRNVARHLLIAAFTPDGV